MKKMDKKTWKKRITNASKAIGTYNNSFNDMIDTLSDILEQRDRAYDVYIEAGAEPCIIKISDRGAENVAKNPRIQLWIDLNAQALAYWRDLGLTPAGLKKLGDNTVTVKSSALEDALSKIG